MGLCSSSPKAPAAKAPFQRKPDTACAISEGEDAQTDLRWVVCGMQGWRHTQEDAHDVRVGKAGTGYADAAFFGVYDGHGGSHVSRLWYAADILRWPGRRGARATMPLSLPVCLLSALPCLRC